MDNSDSGMAKSKLDKSQVLVAVQLRVIYTIELLMSSIKLGLYRLYKKCSIILYNIYLDSFLYSFVFKLQACNEIHLVNHQTNSIIPNSILNRFSQQQSSPQTIASLVGYQTEATLYSN